MKKGMIKRLICLCLVLLTLTSCKTRERTKASSYSPRSIPFQSNFYALDTECNVSLYGKMNATRADEYISDIKNIVNRYELMFSKTNSDSEVYKINNRKSNEIVTYKEVADLFIVAKEMYSWSNGYFDVSASDLCDLWDVKNRKSLPSESEISTAKSFAGNFDYEVTIDYDLNSEKKSKIVFNSNKISRYDFGALVKGYVCDEIHLYLAERKDIDAALVNLGGNVYCYGEMKNRSDKSFKVGIYKPFAENEIIETVSVKNKCVITSGNYQRYFKVDGDDRIYHHIINPKDGYPTNNGIDSVSIVSENGLLGDFLSTASMLLGFDNSKILIDKCKAQFDGQDIEAIFVFSDGRVEKYEANIRDK